MHDLLEQTRVCGTAQVRLPTKESQVIWAAPKCLGFCQRKELICVTNQDD